MVGTGSRLAFMLPGIGTNGNQSTYMTSFLKVLYKASSNIPGGNSHCLQQRFDVDAMLLKFWHAYCRATIPPHIKATVLMYF